MIVGRTDDGQILVEVDDLFLHLNREIQQIPVDAVVTGQDLRAWLKNVHEYVLFESRAQEPNEGEQP